MTLPQTDTFSFLADSSIASQGVSNPACVLPLANSSQVDQELVATGEELANVRDSSPAASEVVRDCVRVWGVPFDRVTRSQAVERIVELVRNRVPSYVITANLNYVMLHHREADMPAITEQASLIVADGQPIVWRSWFGSASLPERVAGSEMIYDLAEAARDNHFRVYFLGGEPGVAVRCANKLAHLYPGLKVVGIESPPFRQLTAKEQFEQYARIRDAKTDLLLVAFGQPKGERWIHEHYQQLGVPVSIQLGASFDFIAGVAHRAPWIYQRLALEWAYRMMSDPRRLVPRYIANAKFLFKSLWAELFRRQSPMHR